MRIASFLGLAATACVLWVSQAHAQRVQFPTKLPINSATTPSGWGSSYPVAQYSAAGGYTAPPASAYQYPGSTYAAPPGAPPATTAPPGATYGANPAYQAPNYTAPGYAPPSYSYPPGVAPGYAPSGPTATFQGTITAPPPVGWDPYATPGVQAPALLPADPYLPGAPCWPWPPGGGYMQTMQRFMDEFRVDYTWMPGNGPEELGMHEADLSVTFAIPFLHNPHTPLLVTPGFATTWWNGPSPPHPPNPELPSRLYAAYLDSAWNPQITPVLGGELAARIGVYSDFREVTVDSIRYQGKGYVLLSISPNMTVKAGVQYLDRQHIKLLPAGGLIWTPNADTRFEIIFPDPKLAWRLHRIGNVDWWFYGRGEYGGDSWTVNDPGGVIETDYNDFRVAIGLESDNPGRLAGYAEVGYSFEREIYQNGAASMTPNSTVFVGAGLSY
ncbi:MAG: hypothetical protein ACOX1P_29365 [Thermoguttaceae bacterium]